MLPLDLHNVRLAIAAVARHRLLAGGSAGRAAWRQPRFLMQRPSIRASTQHERHQGQTRKLQRATDKLTKVAEQSSSGLIARNKCILGRLQVTISTLTVSFAQACQWESANLPLTGGLLYLKVALGLDGIFTTDKGGQVLVLNLDTLGSHASMLLRVRNDYANDLHCHR